MDMVLTDGGGGQWDLVQAEGRRGGGWRGLAEDGPVQQRFESRHMGTPTGTQTGMGMDAASHVVVGRQTRGAEGASVRRHLCSESISLLSKNPMRASRSGAR